MSTLDDLAGWPVTATLNDFLSGKPIPAGSFTGLQNFLATNWRFFPDWTDKNGGFLPTSPVGPIFYPVFQGQPLVGINPDTALVSRDAGYSPPLGTASPFSPNADASTLPLLALAAAFFLRRT